MPRENVRSCLEQINLGCIVHPESGDQKVHISPQYLRVEAWNQASQALEASRRAPSPKLDLECGSVHKGNIITHDKIRSKVI